MVRLPFSKHANHIRHKPMSFLGNPAKGSRRLFTQQRQFTRKKGTKSAAQLNPAPSLQTISQANASIGNRLKSATDSTSQGLRSATDIANERLDKATTGINSAIADANRRATDTIGSTAEGIKTLPGISIYGAGLNGTVGPAGVNLT